MSISIQEKIQNDLFTMQDIEYRDFHSKLIPNINPELVIGVRTPELRKYAKQLAKTPSACEFLNILPHQYYEENNLHGFLIEGMKDFNTVIQALDTFLPYVDNWATCDMMAPKVFKKHLPELLTKIKEWMASEHVYAVRFGMGMLLKYYLDDAFSPKYLEWVTSVKSEEYYIKMMVAWYFATALAKQYEATLPYIEKRSLEQWTHNKAIQKASESYRITPEQKEYLRSLKYKK
uniref:DNA alkylation repair protein n=1 Tax=Acetatifactor sp. TaxID=1872090 RepID=UPI0040575033